MTRPFLRYGNSEVGAYFFPIGKANEKWLGPACVVAFRLRHSVGAGANQIAGRQEMPKFVLVTGGAGYVGSHACKELAAADFVLVTYVDLSRGNSWAVKWGPLERGEPNQSSFERV